MNMFWRGRRVLVTGHTGFKGGWLVLYLNALGARVYGYGLSRTAGPSLYAAARIRDRIDGEAREDILDGVALRSAMDAFRPDVVFHLAARAIVRQSFSDPVGTVRANVMGTTEVLEAARRSGVRATVVATTDKVYRNDNTGRPFTEDAPLGGLDPYGASKAAAEIVVASYRATYGLNVATARSGNVIGGGDWGAHRLVPNCLRSFPDGEVVANPASRPFLHVLDSVAGYVALGQWLATSGEDKGSAFNFGPPDSMQVGDLARRVADLVGGGRVLEAPSPAVGEARELVLSSERAAAVLGWRPTWSTDEALVRTVAWHQAWADGSDMALVSAEQIAEHQAPGCRAA